MKRLNRQFDIELRSESEGNTCEGLACVFNQVTDLGWFTEEIDPHAFDNADMSDVVLLFNHDENYVLAGTRNSSLELSVENSGLFQKSQIINTTQGEDVLKLVKQGLINKMSFAFTVSADGGCEWFSDGREKEHRVIKKIEKLYDVSLVTRPAYEQTFAFARSEKDLDTEAQEHLKRKQQDKEMEKLINGNE